LEFDVQAEVLGGGEYQPLLDVRGLPCWPSQPDYRQLVDGDRLAAEGRDFESHWDRRCVGRKTLRVVKDFDFVVLGVGIGAVPHVCSELVARDARWADMVRHGKRVATQAFQIWMREDSWAVPPCALAYFCCVLPDAEAPADRADGDYPARQREAVRRNAIHFLNHHIGHLWPNAVHAPGQFRWPLLIDPAEPSPAAGVAADEARFASQFWTANVNPSDRYSLCLPGSPKYRISPLDNTYDNLTIAGDWTDCGFNEGCVEAAVMSGRLAAHALAHSPPLEDIVGYDHP
jgi:hypothetical protein